MDIIKRIDSRGNPDREEAISDLRYMETLNSERAKEEFLGSWLVEPDVLDAPADLAYREVIVEYVALLEELNANIQRQA